MILKSTKQNNISETNSLNFNILRSYMTPSDPSDDVGGRVVKCKESTQTLIQYIINKITTNQNLKIEHLLPVDIVLKIYINIC